MGAQTRVFINSALFQKISINTRQTCHNDTFALAKGRSKLRVDNDGHCNTIMKPPKRETSVM